MNILFIGDIIGKPGRHFLASRISQLKSEYEPDFIIANAENAAGGFGLTPEVAQELFSLGIHVLTSGNHIWDKKQIIPVLGQEARILRPANYPDGVPGRGWGIFEAKLGNPKIGVLNLEGRVFMNPLPDPFMLGRQLLADMRKETPILFVDFHAETTSEKRALGWHLDGLASAVIGTHTHIQTADEEILPNGTAYLTDAGMTGGRDSVIGVEKQEALHRFLYQLPTRFNPAPGRPMINAVLVSVQPATGKAERIQRIQIFSE